MLFYITTIRTACLVLPELHIVPADCIIFLLFQNIILPFREKEKAEIKDKKVLLILQQKDDKISELEKLAISLKQEVNSLIAL